MSATSAHELAAAWERALAADERERVRRACREYFETLGGAAERTWSVIKAYVK